MPARERARGDSNVAIKELLESIAERVGRAGVSMVFGEPHVVRTRTVIPVASVSFGFGGGGGESAHDEGDQPASSGGGGGGGGKATPVAVIEVSDEGTHVLPIVDITRIRLAGFACLALGLWVLGRALPRIMRHR